MSKIKDAELLKKYHAELAAWSQRIAKAAANLTKLEREFLSPRERAIKILQRAENK